MLRQILRKTLIYPWLRDCRRILRDMQAIRRWRSAGRPVPPPEAYKRQTVKEFAKRRQIATLIETGTCWGDMVNACQGVFRTVISVELSPELYEHNVMRFANVSNVRLYRGNSGDLLPTILRDIDAPCLFWLDGHYSGGVTARGSLDTPIMQELAAVFDHPNDQHVLLIDDARCFNGTDDYPTIDGLRDVVNKNLPGWVFEVRDDIIRIYKNA